MTRPVFYVGVYRRIEKPELQLNLHLNYTGQYGADAVKHAEQVHYQFVVGSQKDLNGYLPPADFNLRMTRRIPIRMIGSVAQDHFKRFSSVSGRIKYHVLRPKGQPSVGITHVIQPKALLPRNVFSDVPGLGSLLEFLTTSDLGHLDVDFIRSTNDPAQPRIYQLNRAKLKVAEAVPRLEWQFGMHRRVRQIIRKLSGLTLD